jgi:Heterokaryon incompatibility protein (HET)
MSAYSQALNSSRKEIRRLVLHPGRDHDLIRCSTEIVALTDAPEYEALSYVWGGISTPGSNIALNGIHLHITKNLAVALFHLRLPDMPRNLWIDALCINQSDVSERNEQVKMMGEIYSRAREVLIWLGEGEESSDLAYELMLNFPSGSGDLIEQTELELFNLITYCITTRAWFDRLWTVQELVLASPDPLVGCGFKWISWSTLWKTWDRVAKKEFDRMGMATSAPMSGFAVGLQDIRPTAMRIDSLNSLRSAFGAHKGDELRNLLLGTSASQATEPKDRIYALLGLMREEDRQLIKVDYARPCWAIYAEAISVILQRTNGTFFLSGVELAGSTSEPSYPSWVPRFGFKYFLNPTRYHPAGVGASGPGNDCQNGAVDTDLRTLRVRGMPIDVVVDKLSFNEDRTCVEQLPNAETMANKAHELAAFHQDERPYLHSLKTKEPLWRTLIANKTYTTKNREPAPELYGDMYRSIRSRQDDPSSVQGTSESVNDDYYQRLWNHLPSNCFFVTKSGFCGVGPSNIEIGDHLAIWFGAPVPFVLRQNEDQAQVKREGEFACSVVGVAYVGGIMDGEIVDEVYCEDLEDDVTFVVQ